MSDLLPAVPPSSGLPEPGYAPYGPVQELGAAPASARLRRVLMFLRKFWWIPAVTTIVGLAGAVAFVLWDPPTFVSYARMWEAEKMRLPGGAAFDEDNQTYYGTQAELLQSTKLTDLTLENLKTVRTNALPADKSGRPLKVKVKVRQQPRSTVLLLETSSADAEFTRAYLDSLMRVFQTYRRSVRQEVSGSAQISISEQIKRLETTLSIDQRQFNEFQKTNNIAVLQEEAMVSGGYLARLKTQLSDLQLETRLLAAAMLEHSSASSALSNAVPYLLDSLRAASSSSSQSMGVERQSTFNQLELLRVQRQKLSTIYKPKHPKMAKLDADIERGQKLAELYRNQTLDQLASAQQAVRMRTENVTASIKEWEGRLVESKARIAEADRLRQNVTRSQGLYDRLLLLLENVNISRDINQDTLSILDDATPAELSYKKPILVIVLGVCLGLAIGLALVWLIEIRDDRFTSLNEVTATFGDSIVGQVPEVQEVEPYAANGQLGTPEQHHLVAESYRSLRSALLFVANETERPKVILITSSVPHEGKSTIAVNLARTMALGGSKVLLVDGDLRNGHLHHRLGLKSGPGLVELLGRTAPIDSVLQTNCVANLSFIGRGAGHEQPGDLLLAPTFDHALAQWRLQFDYILIDSCPVFAAADVATMAPKADGTLFVVSRRYSSARVVREALELLLRRQTRILGLVFNRANASARSYHYYKYADYYGKRDAATKS